MTLLLFILSLSACGPKDGEPRANDTGQADSGDTNPGETGSSAPSYTFELLDHPEAASQTVPLAMADDGTIAGWFTDADGIYHGFTYKDGEFTTFDVPDAVDTFGVTAYGDTLQGTYKDAEGHLHGFLYEDGTWNTLDVPEAAFTSGIRFEVGTGAGTEAFLMNTAGVIVGDYATEDGVGHGFILEDGVYTTVDHPDALDEEGPNTTLFTSTLDGRVVGRLIVDRRAKFEGFLLQDGEFTRLVHPDQGGFFGTQTNGINEAGAIVGTYTDADNVLHGLLLEDDTWYTIDYPDAPYSEIHFISDDGTLTGSWYDADGIMHGFVARRE